MTSDLSLAFRRLKPGRHVRALTARPRGALPFVDLSKAPPRNLLLDSTVYIDELQARLPPDVETLLRAVTLWHSPVTAAEFAIGAGNLDPAHADTRRAIDTITRSLERRPPHRTLTPDSQIWVEAGLATGLLARLQRHAKADRGRLLNDALLYFTAAKNGCAVLTRNITGFDLLLQISPSNRVLFYALA